MFYIMVVYSNDRSSLACRRVNLHVGIANHLIANHLIRTNEQTNSQPTLGIIMVIIAMRVTCKMAVEIASILLVLRTLWLGHAPHLGGVASICKKTC